ncbi:MAG: tyrosine-protein phosphatase [Bacteroidaceae bacterium]|nr:tyrosine-protein phosphatase [Bacteroidaceae bacterium]
MKNYLDNGTNDYTDDNYTGNNSKTHVANYAPSVGGYYPGGSSTARVDIPNPVSLDWGTASSGTVTITVYNDQALTDEFWTWTATKGSTSYDIYNLIPGRTYYCTVVDDANSNYLYKATFNTEGRRRMLKVSDTVSQDNANNCRDLGGMITKDGTKRIKYGMIYRGTNLTSTTTAEKKVLAEFMNIGLDNDLRDGGNINSASGSSSNRNNPFLNSNYPVVMYPNPVNSYADIVYCGPGYGTGIGSTTGSSLTNPDRVYETMMAFIDCAKRGKASYFHCYIGSDRTGYWGLVIEGLLGVSAKDCSIDFELTSFANSVTMGNRERTSGTYADGMNYFKGKSYYSTFANDPDHQLQKTITKYLIDEVGISEADIETFKNLLLEDI